MADPSCASTLRNCKQGQGLTDRCKVGDRVESFLPDVSFAVGSVGEKFAGLTGAFRCGDLCETKTAQGSDDEQIPGDARTGIRRGEMLGRRLYSFRLPGEFRGHGYVSASYRMRCRMRCLRNEGDHEARSCVFGHIKEV